MNESINPSMTIIFIGLFSCLVVYLCVALCTYSYLIPDTLVLYVPVTGTHGCVYYESRVLITNTVSIISFEIKIPDSILVLFKPRSVFSPACSTVPCTYLHTVCAAAFCIHLQMKQEEARTKGGKRI